MKKTKTLKKNIEFRKVLNKGKYYTGKYIESFVIKNNKSINRIGLAISVKTANAVKRNKIKRLIRENYRLLENKMNTGYEIVFLWKKKSNVEDISFYNIKSDIEKIIEDIGMLI